MSKTQFIGSDPKIKDILQLVQHVADTDATVLITGESGTGKELIARILHEDSSRATNPFIAVNCGALTETLQESELFGHVRGAFTGASSKKIGKFEAAHRGTIFLDEISEMSKVLQVKLLRILQSGEYAPVGMAYNCYSDVRIVAATNQTLQPLVEAGEFRQDLYYRLNVICLDLPPLRERKQDIPLMLDHFLKIFKNVYDKPELQICPEIVDVLMQYDYPGNVRELENIIRRSIILCYEDRISCQYLPSYIFEERIHTLEEHPKDFHQAKAQVVEEFERDYLTSKLKDCGGIISRAAESAGLSERNFHEKMKKYGIRGKAFRAEVNAG
ncbi:MAG: sigma-54 interaction domain-containing protein [bacterium]